MQRHLATLAVSSAIALSIASSLAQAQSSAIGFQARLTGVTDGPHTMTFALYDVETGGTALQTVGPQGVSVAVGIVSTSVAFDPLHLHGQPRWVGIRVDGGLELPPRTALSSVPFALNSRGVFGTSTSEISRLAPPDAAITVGTDSYAAGATAGLLFETGNRTAGAIVVEKTQGLGQGSIEDNWMRFFLTRDGQPSSLEYLTITNAGRVGIGNTNPKKRLVVGSTADEAERMPHVDEMIVVGTHFSDAGSSAGIQFQTGNRTGGGIVVEKIASGNNESNRMHFYLNREGLPDAQKYMTIGETGTVQLKVLQILGGSDLAEPFDVGAAGEEGAGDGVAHPEPGMVVVIDATNPGKLRVADSPYDTRVAGVISGANGLAPGMVMGKDGCEHTSGEYPVAMTGRVWVMADAAFGAIEPGDRLTASSTPGHAMKAADATRADGAVIGKAMTGLDDGRGMVLVLVNLQ